MIYRYNRSTIEPHPDVLVSREMLIALLKPNITIDCLQHRPHHHNESTTPIATLVAMGIDHLMKISKREAHGHNE